MGTTYAKTGGLYTAVTDVKVKQSGSYVGGNVLYKKISGSYQIIWHSNEAEAKIELVGSYYTSYPYPIFREVWGTVENYASTSMTYRATKDGSAFTNGSCTTNVGQVNLPISGGVLNPAAGHLAWTFNFQINAAGHYDHYVTSQGLIGSTEKLVGGITTY